MLKLSKLFRKKSEKEKVIFEDDKEIVISRCNGRIIQSLCKGKPPKYVAVDVLYFLRNAENKTE